MRHRIALLSLIALMACDGAGTVTEPIAGPRTKDADVFAKAFLDQMQARSFAAEREFCGYFGRDADGYVIAVPPVQGHLDRCAVMELPLGFEAFASYHSHAAFDYGADSEVPSSLDLLVDQQEGIVGYISTPGGRVWFSKDGAAVQLCGRGCITQDPEFVPEVYGPVAYRYTVRDLRRREAGL